MIYDTNFLIALQGRKKGCPAKRAKSWCFENDVGVFYIPEIVKVEFLSGFATNEEGAIYLKDFTVLKIDKHVLKETVNVMRGLRVAGKSIGAADSMIAATARLYGLPLVTDNVRHFERIPGLAVRGFVE